MNLDKYIAVGLSLVFLSACGHQTDSETKPATMEGEANFSIHVVHDGSENPETMRIAEERSIVPAGTKLVHSAQDDTKLLIYERTRINQSCLSSVAAEAHPSHGRPIVEFKLNAFCSELFGKLTTENIGRKFAVIVNDQLVASPSINAPILGGAGFFEGGFDTMQDAREFVRLLDKNIHERKAAMKRK